MPITYSLDRKRKVVSTVAQEIVSCADILAHIREKAEKHLCGYPELFDARDVALDLSNADLLLIAEAMRRVMNTQAAGKVAVITNGALVYGLATSCSAMIEKDHPRFEVFDDVEQAQGWLLGSPAVPEEHLALSS